MSTPGAAEAGVDWRSRMWWLAPLCVVATTAVAVTVLLAPGLGSHVAVPRRLVVDMPRVAVASTVPAAPRPTHLPTATASATPAPVQSTTTGPTTQIVQPQRPVVTVSDDSHDSGREREPADR